jgi:uncharacterized membrane protein
VRAVQHTHTPLPPRSHAGFYLAFPRTDIVNIEVAMNEASMPPIVLAVATPELLKTLQKQYEDLDTFTKQISVPKNRLPNWPGKELQVPPPQT